MHQSQDTPKCRDLVTLLQAQTQVEVALSSAPNTDPNSGRWKTLPATSFARRGGKRHGADAARHCAPQLTEGFTAAALQDRPAESRHVGGYSTGKARTASTDRRHGTPLPAVPPGKPFSFFTLECFSLIQGLP